MGQEILHSGAWNLLQSGLIVIEKWDRYYKAGNFIAKSGRYLKAGKLLKRTPLWH